MYQENLDNFLVLAEELKLKGISGVQQINTGDNVKVIDDRESETSSPGKNETDELIIEEDAISIGDVHGYENTVSNDPLIPKITTSKANTMKRFLCVLSVTKALVTEAT